MLHILCILLKIIGILILVILGFFVLLTGIMLFIPVRYQIDAKGKGDLQSLEIQIKFSWLLHLLSGYVFYTNKKADWQVRTGWKKWNIQKSERNSEPEIKSQNLEKREVPTEQKEEKQSEKTVERMETEQVKIQQSNKQKKRKKISGVDKWNKFFQKIKYTISNLCDKIKLLGEKKDNVLEFLDDELHQNAWKDAKREVIRFLKHLRPKKIKGRVHFGFSDPYLTGKTLAILSVWYPFYANTVSLEPDFEESVLEGELRVKGYARGFYFLLPVFRVIRSKEIRQTYKDIRAFQL